MGLWCDRSLVLGEDVLSILRQAFRERFSLVIVGFVCYNIFR